MKIDGTQTRADFIKLSAFVRVHPRPIFSEDVTMITQPKKISALGTIRTFLKEGT
jgi:hypothetical protein